MKRFVRISVFLLWVVVVSLAPPGFGLAQLPWDHPVYLSRVLGCWDLPMPECEKALGEPDGVKMVMEVSEGWIQSHFDVPGTVYGSLMLHGLEIDVQGVDEPRVVLMVSMIGLDGQVACQVHLEFSYNVSQDWMVPSCYPMQAYRSINILAWDRIFPATYPWTAKIDAISGQALIEYIPIAPNYTGPYP